MTTLLISVLIISTLSLLASVATLVIIGIAAKKALPLLEMFTGE